MCGPRVGSRYRFQSNPATELVRRGLGVQCACNRFITQAESSPVTPACDRPRLPRNANIRRRHTCLTQPAP